MNKHTPTPWQANKSEVEANSSLVEIRGPNDAYSVTRDVSAANAVFICRAVNHHEELVSLVASLVMLTKATDFQLPGVGLRWAKEILAKLDSEK